MSESPIVLYAGLLSGQMVLQSVDKPELEKGVKLIPEEPEYKGRYICPTEAGLPKFYEISTDDDMRFWREQKQ